MEVVLRGPGSRFSCASWYSYCAGTRLAAKFALLADRAILVLDHDLVIGVLCHKPLCAVVRPRAAAGWPLGPRCRGPRAGAETARSLVYQSPETIFSDITIHFGPIERAASGQASAAPLAAGEGGRRRGACAARPAMHTDRPARRPWVLALRYRTAYQLRQAGQSRTRSQHRHFAG